MKKFRKLIPALALLLVSAVLMSTASYAWFSMNNRVTVTGMEVKTKVSSNLLIAEDTAASTSKKSESEFKSAINQVVKGILEPSSTSTAKDYYYTVDAKANGERLTSNATFYAYDPSTPATDSSAYADKFSEVYGVTKSSATATYDYKAVPYVDYVFQVKATNTSAATQYIIVNKLELTYHGSTTDNTTAQRIAFFVEDITTSGPTGSLPATVFAQYKVTSAANFNNEVITSTAPATATASYVSTTAAPLTSVGNDSVPHYYKITVRMWLEGQDTTCNNTTYMNLTDAWTLEVQLSLVDSAEKDSGVTTITKA